ncbi:MAG TPA: CotH kinase family protein, partial [Tepidisphaeraceae bacterium]
MLLLAHPARAAGEPADPAGGFFGPDRIYRVHLHLTAHAWSLMQPTRRARPVALVADSIPAPTGEATHRATAAPAPREKKGPAVEGDKLPPNNFAFEYVYVKAKLELGDQTLTDVALRFKGNASYDNFNDGPGRPYKIEFDRFVPGRKFKGLSCLNLSNNAFDPSLLREAASYEVYRRAGVPTPRTALAMLYLSVDGLFDRQYLGVYTLIEEIDDRPFLKRHFGNADGLLFKPEGIRGLPYMGEDIANYAERYHPKNHGPDDPAIGRRFIDFVKLVNYADDAAFQQRIGEYLAVDDFLRYLAATVLISNLDSPLVTNHNFYLYVNPADGRVWIMPWDMNLSFAGYGSPGPPDRQIFLSISHPWAGHVKLFERLMKIPEYDRAYRAHLRDFIQQFFNDATMHPLLDTMKGALAEADKALLADGRGNNQRGFREFGRARFTLKTYVTGRARNVLDQIDGKDVLTFVPTPNPPNAAFNWGLHAPHEFGQLTTMARAIRLAADTGGDFKLSREELHAAAEALYVKTAGDPPLAALKLSDLSRGLAPLLAEGQVTRRQSGWWVFFGGGGGAGDGSAAGLWAGT